MKLIKGKDWTTATVGGLIEMLQELDPNALVLTEGCDCYGNVVDVSVDKEGVVLIERDDRMGEYVGDDYVLKEKYRDRVFTR